MTIPISKRRAEFELDLGPVKSGTICASKFARLMHRPFSGGRGKGGARLHVVEEVREADRGEDAKRHAARPRLACGFSPRRCTWLEAPTGRSLSGCKLGEVEGFQPAVVLYLDYAHDRRFGRWSLFNDAIRV